MPAAAATSSIVTCSKPFRRKSSSAACSIRARVSARAADPVSVTAHILRHLRARRLPVAPGATSVRDVPTALAPEVRMPEPTAATDVETEVEAPAAEEALVEESLVEEVSIDGMCGV